ncbi:MAG TPA: PEGA domain-containing protein [Chthoniobacterales bacterium]|nr:PEGA domain-containing protein [Chthoniobacterales bacterium]
MENNPAGNTALPIVPDYELLRVIGRGAYGEIWLARGLTGALRAVKIVHRKTFESERAFNREFSGMSAFEPISRAHAGFVDILHVGRNDAAGFFYYVMELADDETSGARIEIKRYTPKTLKVASGAALPVSECIRLGLLLTEALEALHGHGLTHRDIKPSNIIFVEGAPKLADIGLVATSGQQSFVGTEGYVPPEGPGTPQADIYSAGKVLYEISMGKDRLDFPEVGTDLDARPDKAQLLELNSVLLKACASQPTKRYRSAEEMREDLARLAGGEPAKRSRAGWIVAALILCGLLLAIPWFVHWRQARIFTEEPPAFATATITTEPAGAMILFGDRMKRSPARFEGIEPGKHPLRVMLPGFDPIETRIQLGAGEAANPPAFKLLRSKGAIQLSSEPAGVAFELSREGEPARRGKTPATLRDLPTGVYEVAAQHGEWELRDRIEIKRGEVAQKLFDFATGKIAVTSAPPGAEIFVDGKQRGVAPFELELPAGAHHLSARIAGWPAEEREVEVEKSKQTTAAFEFANGSVKIITAPAGAIVLSDGRELGLTPLLLEEVKPGEIAYELRLPGFKPATLRGTVQSKRQTFLDARLEKSAPAARADVWENSLGMRLVRAADFHICVWETRVRDWDAFCQATGRASAAPDFGQSPNDPVVKVNWQDALDFCAWLTLEERRQNLIDESESYRLPTDQEWSRAVGLNDESGATPEERDGQSRGVYPWGKQWPPPAGAGNFADQTNLRRRGPVIAGYNDGFATTAPCGSFQPNALGLYDLSGNVWEWCADLYKSGSRWGVLRGGSWANSNATELLSSYRNVIDRNERDVIYGFRCVLARTPVR